MRSENEISSLAGKDTFDEMMKLFDDSIGEDSITAKDALDRLDKIINDIILLK